MKNLPCHVSIGALAAAVMLAPASAAATECSRLLTRVNESETGREAFAEAWLMTLNAGSPDTRTCNVDASKGIAAAVIRACESGASSMKPAIEVHAGIWGFTCVLSAHLDQAPEVIHGRVQRCIDQEPGDFAPKIELCTKRVVESFE